MNREAQQQEPVKQFSDAIAYLSSFTDYEQGAADKLNRHSLDLNRMLQLSAWFENPAKACPIVHIAGTKGKGTTALILDSILRAHGLSTGRFLSPHLTHVAERISIDGEDLGEKSFCELVEHVRKFVQHHQASSPGQLPSFFESITIMAFLEFRRRQVDCAVVEVGLGGRLDATNIVDPTVSIITSIDLEHTRVLGRTREEIAGEKAGIIKDHKPLVCGVRRDSPEGRRIESVALEHESPVLWLNDDLLVEIQETSSSGQDFSVTVLGRRFDDLSLHSPGPHQVQNAALAMASATLLENNKLIRLDDMKMREGIASANLPGRLELLPPNSTSPPLPFPLLLDTAHTPGSMTALAGTIPTCFGDIRPTLLLGMLRDKDPAGCLAPLDGLLAEVFTMAPPSPRALEPDVLARKLADVLPGTRITPLIDVDCRDFQLGSIECPGLVVTGSTYLTGMLRGRYRPIVTHP